MTDNEIIKAKEIIKNLHTYCFVSQPTYKQMGYVFCEKDFDILNELIDDYNHQKAEIEKLEKIEHYADKTIEKQSAEIERLEEEIKSVRYCYEQAKSYNDTLAESCEKNCKKFNMATRGEAIKEIAERLHDKFISEVQKHYCRINSEHSYKYTEGYTVDDVLSTIDNLVKEMGGD